MRKKATNLPRFWLLFSVFLMYLPLFISWGGRNGCKHTQSICQVWVSSAAAPAVAPKLMNQRVWVYPKRIGTNHIFHQILLGHFSGRLLVVFHSRTELVHG